MTCLAHSAMLAMPRLPQPTAMVMPGLILALTSGRLNCSATVCLTLASLGVVELLADMNHARKRNIQAARNVDFDAIADHV